MTEREAIRNFLDRVLPDGTSLKGEDRAIFVKYLTVVICQLAVEKILDR